MNSDPPRRGPRGNNSRAGILTAADQVLRAEGLDGLSLRAVARQAGVTPNAVYTYVASMAELRNALGDDFLTGLDLGLLRTEAPREALRCFLAHVLQVFARSPHHVAILASQPVVGEGALALHEALLSFFRQRLDWDMTSAAEATMFLTEWVHGHVLLAPSNEALPDPAAMNSVDASQYPRAATALDLSPRGSALDLPLRAIFGTSG